MFPPLAALGLTCCFAGRFAPLPQLLTRLREHQSDNTQKSESHKRNDKGQAKLTQKINTNQLWVFFSILGFALKLFEDLHSKLGLLPQKETIVFQPSHFSGVNSLLVSGRLKPRNQKKPGSPGSSGTFRSRAPLETSPSSEGLVFWLVLKPLR